MTKTGMIWPALLLAASLALMPFDIPFAQAMQGLPDGVHRFFGFLTQFGEAQWYLVPSGAVVMILLLVPSLRGGDKPTKQSRGKCTKILDCFATLAMTKKKFSAALFLFAAVAISGIATDILKAFFGKARPKIFFDTGFYGFTGPGTVPQWPDYASYPSGHTTTAIAAGLALGYIFPRWRVAIWPVFVLIALTRPLITAHWISDIPAGAAVAVAVTFWLYAFFIRKGLLEK